MILNNVLMFEDSFTINQNQCEQCEGQMSIYDFPECLPQKEYEEMHEKAILIKDMLNSLAKGVTIEAPSYWSKYL